MKNIDPATCRSFGDRLKYGRKHVAGISQGELATRMGLQQAYISQLETGSKQSSSHAVSLADHVGITVRWLLSGSGPITIDKLDSTTEPFEKLRTAAAKYALSGDELDKVEEIALREMQEIFLNR